MHPEIEQRFGNLEVRREDLVARVHALPAEKQTIRPDAKSFSPAEVIMHMALSELASVKRIQQCPPSAMKGKKAKTTFIYKKVVKDMENGKKMSTPPDMVPKDRFTLEQAEREWDRARQQLKVYFAEVKGPNEPIQKFFLFGTMSASDLLALFEAHHHYHEMLFPKV